MSHFHYHDTYSYKKKQKRAKESFNSLLGLLALPFLPFIWLIKIFLRPKKESKKRRE